MKIKLNILVTGCGGDIGQSIGKILLLSNYTNKLFGIDISDKNPSTFIYPNFSLGLPCSDPKYLDELISFTKINLIDIIIPASEPELRFLSERKVLTMIGKSKLITASSLSLEIGFDKYKTAKFLESSELPFPKTILNKDLVSLTEFPIILKSKCGNGGKNNYLINTKEEYTFYSKKSKEDLIVQEFIPSTKGEFTCGLFRSKSGKIRSIIFERELYGGYSGYGEVVKNENIKLLLENLAISLNLIGSINVQLRFSEKNKPMIFEINPRFSSTVLFRHLLGFEDLIWSIEDVLGQEINNYLDDNQIGRKFYKGFSEYIK